jgi:quinol monooxygenase YgiN
MIPSRNPAMKNTMPRSLVALLAAAILAGGAARAADGEGAQLSHVVAFTLKDHSKEAREKLVASCKKHLAGHEGVVSFSVGTIAEDVKEPVSDRDFDVTIHLVFRDKAAGAAYLVHPRHRKFVDENKDTWARVRVFDSYLSAP